MLPCYLKYLKYSIYIIVKIFLYHFHFCLKYYSLKRVLAILGNKVENQIVKSIL